MWPRLALGILIVTATLARLVLASHLGPGNDEAYHWLYAVHPALSYFDHPPMMAWIERAGLRVLGDESPLAPRIGFVLLSAGSTWLMARLTSRFLGAWAGFWAALALNAAPYYGLAAGTFVLPDGPLVFFWLLVLDRLAVALEASPDRWAPWIAVGLAWGGALLSKYHALLLPSIVLATVVLHRPWRVWLRRPGPYLALALGMLAFSPVLIWNAEHGWVSLRFQGGRAVGSWVPRPDLLARGLAGQALYMTPWIWGFLAVVLVRGWRRRRETSGFTLLLLVAASVPLALVGLVSLFRPILPHWALIGGMTLMPLLGRDWAAAFDGRPVVTIRRSLVLLSTPLLVGVLLLGQYHHGWLQAGAPGRLGLLSGAADPTADTYGWDQIVARLEQSGWLDDPNTFVFTGNWYRSGHLARALRNRVPVLCYHEADARGFRFWSLPEQWVGRDGLLVTVGEIRGEPDYYQKWFTRLEPIDEFWVERAGGRLARVRITRCVAQVRPFPFGPLADTSNPNDRARR